MPIPALSGQNIHPASSSENPKRRFPWPTPEQAKSKPAYAVLKQYIWWQGDDNMMESLVNETIGVFCNNANSYSDNLIPHLHYDSSKWTKITPGSEKYDVMAHGSIMTIYYKKFSSGDINFKYRK